MDITLVMEIIYKIFKHLPLTWKYYVYKIYFHKYKVERVKTDMLLYWNRYKIIFPIGYTPIVETLGKQLYNGENIDIVLDVGAGVGDSAVYFVYRGARKVVSYEPNPLIYNYLVKNIGLNNLERRIIPKKECVGVMGYYTDWSRIKYYKPNNNIYRVDWLQVLEENNYTLCKVDCEGCEWSLTQTIISKCHEWIIEVHGKLDTFLRKIPKEYNIRIINIKRFSDLGNPVTLIHLF